MRQPKNDGHKTYFHIRKKYKRHFENIRHLGKFSLAIFFGISWDFVLQDCFLRL
jgi:hypothetical protein